jgi:hypothetical protein
VRKLVRNPGRAVILTVASRGWNTASGLITLFLLTKTLSPSQQGFYYLILSVGAMQAFAELGLGVAVINLVSHEMGSLHWNSGKKLDGNPLALARLRSVVQFSNRWFSRAALVLAATLCSAAWLYFSTLTKGPNFYQVLTPLILYIATICTSLIMESWLALLLGSGRGDFVGYCRLLQAVLSSLLLWVTLLGGLGLFALGISAGIPVVVNILVISRQFGPTYRWLRKPDAIHSGERPLSWKKEIWPFQWRLGVSFASGFFLSQIITPIALRRHGPVVAGQIGVSMQIVTSINVLAFGWVSTKSASFGSLLARNERKQLRASFWAAALGSTLLAVVGFSAAFGLVSLRSLSGISGRILPLRYFGWLCGLGMINHLIYVASSFLRSLRTDPMWLVSLVQGLVTTVAAMLLPSGKFSSSLLALSLGVVAVSLPCTCALFVTSWMRNAASPEPP